MPRLKLTDLSVKRVTSKPPAAGRVDYFDKTLPAFGIRVSSTGSASWFLFYRIDGKQVRDVFAKHPVKGLAAARQEARDRLELVNRGRDPRTEEARQRAQEVRHRAETFGAIADSYKKAHLDKLRSGAASWAAMQADLLPIWEDLPIRDLTRGAVMARLDEIEIERGPIARNRRLALIRPLLNWALDRELVTANVAARIPLLDEKSRSRILSDVELVGVWKASDLLPAPQGPATKMLILSLQRRSEVFRAEAVEVDRPGRLWTIDARRMKGKLTHAVPLTEAMLDVLDGLPKSDPQPEHVFASTARRQSTPFGDHGDLKDQLDLNIGHAHEPQATPRPGQTLAISQLTQPTVKDQPVILTAKVHAPFAKADVGRLIGISHNGKWGYARCIEFLTPTTMACRIVAPFASTAPSDLWSLGWTPWRLHDLRRTGRTGLSRLRVPKEIRERVIAHVPGGVEAVYDLHEFLDEKRDALERWNAFVMALVDPQPKVTSFDQARLKRARKKG